jgi:hypothetical protein
MANKIIKYNLNANGTIPDYIDDGGYFPKANGGNSPQDYDMIGATVDGSSETGLGELASEAAVKSYLDTYTGDWTIRNITTQSDDPFDQAAEAENIWTKKID